MLRLILILWALTLPLVPMAQDLDGDTDHSGAIDGSRAEENLERTQPVILLNNCDDDDMDAVADNLDGARNGRQDRPDWEPIVIRRMADAPAFRVSLRASSVAGKYAVTGHGIRIIDRQGAEIIGPHAGTEYVLPRAELAGLAKGDLAFLAEGLKFSAEVRLDLMVDQEIADSLMLKVAPFLMLPHTQDAIRNFVVETSQPESVAFVQDFQAANANAGVTPVVVDEEDVWIEDEMQWGYTQTPRVTLPVVLHMHRQRELENEVAELLRPDIGYFKAFSYPANGNSLDYGGNLEVTPPTRAHPYGRVYYGGTPSVSSRANTYD